MTLHCVTCWDVSVEGRRAKDDHNSERLCHFHLSICLKGQRRGNRLREVKYLVQG